MQIAVCDYRCQAAIIFSKACNADCNVHYVCASFEEPAIY